MRPKLFPSVIYAQILTFAALANQRKLRHNLNIQSARTPK
jgi:hypothetical protein